jgi:2-phosphosulfolactate phosphatase
MAVRLDVALVPAEADTWRDGVCIVVDALRASATVVAMLDAGATGVLPVADTEEARRLAAELGAILAGEVDGLRPRGFDLDNSPREVAAADLRGRTVVLRTSNGTAVLRRLRHARRVLVGSLPNATAVARAALGLAREDGRIAIVCAGREAAFVLDDALVAGVLAGVIERLAAADGVPVVLGDGALAARRIAGDERDLAAGVLASASGHRVIELGLEDDLDRCLRRDVSHSVPVLVDGTSPRLEPLAFQEDSP